VAAESSNLTRYQILQQAAGAMLSQANATPQIALSLLRG
jgi:flagellin-like hook-associated protein FlgL